MRKLTLESIIEKYYLNGLVEKIKWEVKDKNLLIKFNPEEMRSLMGVINHSNINLPDGEILIYNTTQLLKLVKILGHEINLDVYIERKTPLKLLISDNEFDLEFYLADKNLVSNKIPELNDIEFDISFKIDKEFINKFKSAKKGLGSEVTKFTIEANQLKTKEVIFTIGDLNNHSNKVKFSNYTESEIPINLIPFNSNVFNEILISNENADEGTFDLSKEGLIRLMFKEGETDSTYYLVRLDEES